MKSELQDILYADVLIQDFSHLNVDDELLTQALQKLTNTIKDNRIPKALSSLQIRVSKIYLMEVELFTELEKTRKNLSPDERFKLNERIKVLTEAYALYEVNI